MMQAFLKGQKNIPKESTSSAQSSSADANTLKELKKANRPLPWIEKYRPKKVEDVVEQDEIVAVLKECLQSSDLPNLLLYGPPGTGKTSTILAAARQLFAESFKDRVLELNASDDRGINVVRTKVKNFAQLKASSVRPDGSPCPPFKIVILDEADAMTHAAQAALRRTMEKETRTTRFCLICNYVSRIIEPITSRCTKFRFKPLGEEKIIERLELICSQENLEIEKDSLKSIVEISDGDLRRAITTLQSCFRLKCSGEEKKILLEDVEEMSGIIPIKFIKDYMDICSSGDYKKLEDFVNDFLNEAYSVGQFFDQLNDYVVENEFYTNPQKSAICDKLGESSYFLSTGGSEYIQLMNQGCSNISALLKK